MKRVTFAVPGDLDTPTGGYAYDRRIIAELRRTGWHVDVVDLGEGFPFPSTETKASAYAQLAAVPKHPTIIDGLAFGVLPDAAATMKSPPIALVHHPLAMETGLSNADSERLKESEHAALRTARAVIVTSPATARALSAQFGVDAAKIVVAEPGVDRCTAQRVQPQSGIIHLLSVGALSPRKGYDVLVEALAALRDRDWRLTIVGAADRDPAFAHTLTAQIAAHQLGERITLTGTVSSADLAALFMAADVFVLASRLEGYGMAYAEAIAAGLPVIGTTSGAIPDTVPPGTGLLVQPGDVGALADALQRVLDQPDLRHQFAAAAQAAAGSLPRWEIAAERIAALLEELS